MDCLFCKIANGDIKAQIIYENDELLAFNDIAAVAPTHILIIPKQHIATLNDINDSHHQLLAKMLGLVPKIAAELSIEKEGYRIVMNTNHHGGQTIYHIHLHLLAGREMTWPPG